MVLTFRIDAEDQKMLEELENFMLEEYKNIFGIDTKITKSEVIRASIRYMYLIKIESNK